MTLESNEALVIVPFGETHLGSLGAYEALYRESIQDPSSFFAKVPFLVCVRTCTLY